MNAARKNLWTAILAAGVCAILITAITLLSVDTLNDYISKRPSTFFSDRTGTRALFLVLQRIFPTTDQWRRPFNESRGDPKSLQRMRRTIYPGGISRDMVCSPGLTCLEKTPSQRPLQ